MHQVLTGHVPVLTDYKVYPVLVMKVVQVAVSLAVQVVLEEMTAAAVEDDGWWQYQAYESGRIVVVVAAVAAAAAVIVTVVAVAGEVRISTVAAVVARYCESAVAAESPPVAGAGFGTG